jgi:hypothetical protein
MLRAACGASLIVALQAPHASAQKTLGIVPNDAILPDSTRAVIVFDADTDTVIGTVFIPSNPSPSLVFRDAEIVASQFVGLVGVSGNLWVIDLSSPTPTLSAGTNPIDISSPATDTAISPDDMFVVAVDGTTGVPPAFDAPPVSASNIAARTEVSTFGTVLDNNGVDVCADGSVLIASFNGFAVRKLGLDGSGTLSDTGLSLATDESPHNIACAPGGLSAVVVGGEFGQNGILTSFIVPTLTAVDTRTLSAQIGQTPVFSPTGDRVFVRSAAGTIDVFAFNPATGSLGNAPLLTIPINPFPDPDVGFFSHFGQDLLAIHPNGSKLYVSEPNAIRVFDANSGALLTTITGPNVTHPQGLAVKTLPNQSPVCTAVTVAPTTLSPNPLFVPLTMTGATDPDGDPVTLSVTSVFQDEPVNEIGAGAGTSSPDASLLPLAVRAERNGTGDGRVYHIAFTADDGKGGTCSGTAPVCVQHDRGTGSSSCIDGGPLFNSLEP